MTFIEKIMQLNLDMSLASGNKTAYFWNYVHDHIATNSKEYAICLAMLAKNHIKNQEVNLGIETLRTGIQHLSITDDTELYLTLKNQLAGYWIDQIKYRSALDEYIHCSEIAAEHGLLDAYVQAVLGMGNLCDIYGEHSRALRYYQKVDHLYQSIDLPELKLQYKLYTLACLIHLKQFNKAKPLIKECESLSLIAQDPLLTGQVLLYKARIYRHLGNTVSALSMLNKIQYQPGNITSVWLSNLVRIEKVYCLTGLKRSHISTFILESIEKRLLGISTPILQKYLYTAFSQINEFKENYKTALNYEKLLYRIESDLMEEVPISELGANQLRRLSRLETRLKLRLSEIENQELKETTLHQKHTVEQLQQDVYTDPLTQLHNRRWLDIKLSELMKNNTPFAFLIIDIDHFKSINDNFSHLVGDKAIIQVAHELNTFCQHSLPSSCVRFGGEEFLVILENTNSEQSIAAAEQIRIQIQDFDWHAILGKRQLTVSIGVTLYNDGEHFQKTFNRADKALYQAKANGRNQVCFESY